MNGTNKRRKPGKIQVSQITIGLLLPAGLQSCSWPLLTYISIVLKVGAILLNTSLACFFLEKLVYVDVTEAYIGLYDAYKLRSNLDAQPVKRVYIHR